MSPTMDTASSHDEYPPKANLRQKLKQHPLPVIDPGTVDPASMEGDEATKQVSAVLNELNAALEASDAERLASCFFDVQSYWRDQLALTYHLRTFSTPDVIAAALLETKKLRFAGEFKVEGGAQFVPATPVLQFIACRLSFRTGSPAANCRGRMMLMPVKEDGGGKLTWKIWTLGTWLKDLDAWPENEALLQSPGRKSDALETFETDVLIVGAGNSGVALFTRLKALGVGSVMIDRNARPGDNWALRYECMRFHVPTSSCELPYMNYDENLQTPHFLTRDELAEQVKRYVAAFNIDIIHSTTINSTVFNQSSKCWTVKLQTPTGIRTATCKHLVQATGIGSQKIYLPPMLNSELYQGISIHSQKFQSAKALQEKGAKSVLIIGSANTAFDVLEDCHRAGLKTTMNVRSATYICPTEYIFASNNLGAYDLGVEQADILFMTGPTFVDAQLLRDTLAHCASQESDRYKDLIAAGFPVIDGRNAEGGLMYHLIDRAGGHYMDMGGTKPIAEGKVDIKVGVEPVGYTETGLRFSDGSTLDVDAVVWCTGFADKDVRDTAAEILGGADETATEGNDEAKNSLGSRNVASRLDATWGVDEEGEVRGMWKRHLRVENYWVTGGFTQLQRWHSKTLALQIKAALEGILPEAYRDTPDPRKV
ncbi:uncharacterized protein BCR38DRAFT_2169 [Pseudomassariella vexata]|uniref:Monooxygenase n=1 Tax=Pseudomassariella vexata TaxID=1141098 RepID=A0A1Y2EHF6_9PEZI|nr:uncharacterized protein BCR38DRAFT_2169 [Pseudomassariella vexata]ORY70999.1 hypothetical protein BCR38DRAFT_2169 [Pseudomassariella vexata]